MDGIVAWDQRLFRWINDGWSHPAMDVVMRFLSGNRWFYPFLAVVGVALLWKGGKRGVVFVLMMGVGVGLANEFLAEPIKAWAHRLRPWAALEGVHLRGGRGHADQSMPSAHAMNCAVMAVMTFWYYRRAGWIAVVVAIGVGLSRIYNGSHFPSDVLAGAGLGALFAWGWIHGLDGAWRRWMPGWAPRLAGWLPSIRVPDAKPGTGRGEDAMTGTPADAERRRE